MRERQWRRDRLGDRGATSWKDAVKRWLADSPRARKRDREILDWLSKTCDLDEQCVVDVADPDVLEQIRQDGLAEGWTHSTVDRAMGTVSSILKKCAQWRYLDFVPYVPMYRPADAEPHWLTPAEVDRLCGELPMHLILAVRFAVYSLLRMRAMLKMTWDRVNLRDARAWIPGAQQKAARTFGLPLSSESIRVLRMRRCLSGPHSPYVFTWNGRPVDDCNTAAYQEGVRRAGLEPLSWHDLRHTGASWAVQAGVSLPDLMLLGDWKDYRSVLRYAHFAPTQAAPAAEKVAQWAHAARLIPAAVPALPAHSSAQSVHTPRAHGARAAA